MTDAQSGNELPQWVSQLRSRRQRASIGIALNVADAVLALGEPDVPAAVRQRLRSIIERAEQLGAAISVTTAARVLGVSERTARDWVDRGALTFLPGTHPPAVSARSLGEALAAAIVIRDAGRDEVVLRSVLDALEDQRVRADLADRIEELDARLPLDDERLEDLFSET